MSCALRKNGPKISEKNKINFLGPAVSAGGSEMYVSTPAMVIFFPMGSPVCLNPLKQQSPKGPASAGDSLLVDMI